MLHTRDPEAEFHTPKRLADREALTADEKLRILESWQLDLIELQRAEEENMASGDAPDSAATARKLTEVAEAIALVRQQKDGDEPPRPDKPIREPPRKPYKPFRDVPEPKPIDNPKPPGPEGEID